MFTHAQQVGTCLSARKSNLATVARLQKEPGAAALSDTDRPSVKGMRRMTRNSGSFWLCCQRFFVESAQYTCSFMLSYLALIRMRIPKSIDRFKGVLIHPARRRRGGSPGIAATISEV
jgi:hypothetical protein